MELSLDILRHDGLSTVTLQRIANSAPFIPSALGDMQIFNPVPIETEIVHLYTEDGKVTLIPATKRGGPDSVQTRRTGKLYGLETLRLAKKDTVRASELMGIANMALPEPIRLRNALELLNNRTAQLKQDMEFTKELHRMGAIQGKVLDADGTTVLFDFFNQFGISPPTLIDVDFAGIDQYSFMQYLQDTFLRPIMLSLQVGGRWTPQTRIGVLVGDGFWGKLQTNPAFQRIYLLAQQAALMARAANPLVQPNAWGTVDFAGMTFMNYQGSTAGEIAIPYDTAVFFPIGAKDVFNAYWAPGETMLDVNQPGQPQYLYVQPDTHTAMPAFIDVFLRSYPLYSCIYPQALMKARIKP